MTLSIDVKPSNSTVSDKQEPPWEGIRETVELRGSHSEEYEEGFWAGLRAYEDKLREQDWYGQHQWQCGYERGWDAAMENRHEFECPRCGHCCRDGLERLCRIMGTFDLATGHAETIGDALDALESELRDVLGHLRARREWVGLTDEDLEAVFPAIATYHEANKTLYRSIARAIEAKLKEKNT